MVDIYAKNGISEEYTKSLENSNEVLSNESSKWKLNLVMNKKAYIPRPHEIYHNIWV